MKNYHLIEVKYLPCTGTKGAKIKLISHRLQEPITLYRDYAVNANEQALEYLKKQGQKIIGKGETKNDSTIIILNAINNQLKSIK